VQDSLANFQIPYFEACFARRSTRIGGAVPPAAKAFGTQMLALAQTGSFATIITAMFAAEWMYATWCNRAATHPITDPDIREWVDLHAHPDFAAQARWMKDAIDTYADPGEREALSATYHAVIEEEIVFHDAPYGDPAETAG
jgi:thiaminase/transcriptional activator TenA